MTAHVLLTASAKLAFLLSIAALIVPSVQAAAPASDRGFRSNVSCYSAELPLGIPKSAGYAIDMNESADMLISFDSDTYLVSHGHSEKIVVPEALQGLTATALNNQKVVVGYFLEKVVEGYPFYRGFIWARGHSVVVSPSFPNGSIELRDINDQGDVVGEVIEGDGDCISPLFLRAAGADPLGSISVPEFTCQGTYQPGLLTIANSGKMAGSSGYWAGNSFIFSPLFLERKSLEGVFGLPFDMNDQGQVVGRAGLDSYMYPVLWNDSAPIFLKSFNGSMAPGHATGINNAGSIVGTVWVEHDYLGFIYSAGQMQDLNRLLCSPLVKGLHVSEGVSINAHGEILATASGLINGIYHDDIPVALSLVNDSSSQISAGR